MSTCPHVSRAYYFKRSTYKEPTRWPPPPPHKRPDCQDLWHDHERWMNNTVSIFQQHVHAIIHNKFQLIMVCKLLDPENSWAWWEEDSKQPVNGQCTIFKADPERFLQQFVSRNWAWGPLARWWPPFSGKQKKFWKGSRCYRGHYADLSRQLCDKIKKPQPWQDTFHVSAVVIAANQCGFELIQKIHIRLILHPQTTTSWGFSGATLCKEGANICMHLNKVLRIWIWLFLFFSQKKYQ